MPAAKRPARKKKPAFEEGYYITLNVVDDGILLLFGPVTDRAAAKWFRKLVKDAGYNDSDDYAEVRALDADDAKDMVIEAINPIETILNAYVDTDADEEDDE